MQPLPVIADVQYRKPPVTLFSVEIKAAQVSFEVELGQRPCSVATRQHLKVASHGSQHGRQLQLRPTNDRRPTQLTTASTG